MAEPGTMAAMVKGTPLAALLDPAAPPQRSGVIASMNLVADSFQPSSIAISTAVTVDERRSGAGL
jgi:hypothetical protein